MIRVAIIGYGYWGPKLARNFAAVEKSTVQWICDDRPEMLRQAAQSHSNAKIATDSRDILRDPDTDAIAIATPPASHYQLAMNALKAGKHVLLEKPMATSSGQAKRLCDEAAKRKQVLMAGHTFVFHPAVQKIRELVRSGELGEIYYYDAVRVNLGIVRNDVDVLWDVAIHDLSIIDRVLPNEPAAVSAHGMSHFSGSQVNTAYLTLLFNSKLIAHIHSNWLAPVKTRRTLVGGSRKMIIFDELEPSEKIKIYDRGVTITEDAESVYKVLYDYRMGDMHSPRIESTEPLRAEVDHFLKCIERGETPISDGHAGLRIIQILEAAERSLRANGRVIKLK